MTFTPGAVTINGVVLGSTGLGYAIKAGAASPLQITYSGQYTSASNPGGGWRAIAAAAGTAGGGYELYWKNTPTGQYARWNLSSSGDLVSGTVLSAQDLLAAETSLGFDLNGDGTTGVTFTPGAVTINGVVLGSTGLGYAIKAGATAPLQITYSGQYASTSNPGGGWSAIAAAPAAGSGYELYWKNAATGQYAQWQLNISGALTGGGLLTAAELNLLELSQRFDLNGDGKVGPLAERGGSAAGDTLTGLPQTITYGFAGADQLTSGAVSTDGTNFDVLVGGLDNDRYVLPIGYSTVIADSGGNNDLVIAPGFSFNGGTTSLTTLEGGRHLLAENLNNGSWLALLDWQQPAKRIESVQLADGTFSYEQIRQRVQLVAPADFSWTQWLTASGYTGVLRDAGLANSLGIEALIASAQRMDAAGML